MSIKAEEPEEKKSDITLENIQDNIWAVSAFHRYNNLKNCFVILRLRIDENQFSLMLSIKIAIKIKI